MKAKTRPKRAAELTPCDGNMRTKSLPPPRRKAVSKKLVSREVQTKRRSSSKAIGFNGNHVLAAVITLLALLLAGALTIIILEKPQATEAWKLVREIFTPTIAALLAWRCSTPSRRA